MLNWSGNPNCLAHLARQDIRERDLYSAPVLSPAARIAISLRDPRPLSNLLCRNPYHPCTSCSPVPTEKTANAPWEAI